MKLIPYALAAVLAMSALPGAAAAQEAVIAIVNDHPVTSFDIDQRIKLLGMLGITDPAKLNRKAIAEALINDYVKIDEAKLGHISPTDSEVEERLGNIASALKTDKLGLPAKLSSVGITMAALKQYTQAQMSFARLLQIKFRTKVEVDQGAVDKKFAEVKADIEGRAAKFAADPRRQPIQVLSLQEINFPVEGNDSQLLQSRGLEASQVLPKIKSCDGIRSATTGIFNVQIGRKLEADARKVPGPMMAQLNKVGIGRAIGPVRYANGVQLLAYCGSRVIKPPPINIQLPTRQQIEGLAMNQKFEEVEKKFMGVMRKSAIIEFKDPSYGP